MSVIIVNARFVTKGSKQMKTMSTSPSQIVSIGTIFARVAYSDMSFIA